MSIGTYAELQSAISAWLLRASTDAVVTAAQVKNYIFLTEAELNRELRVRELETTAAFSTVAAQDYLTLPTDFKKVVDFTFDDYKGNMNYISSKAELKRKHTTSSGRPTDYTIYGAKIILGDVPDAIYPMTLDYIKAIPALTDSNTTNDILTAYPDLYLYGALRQAYMQIKDSKNGDIAKDNYGGAVERVKLADKEARMPTVLKMQTHRRLA